MDKRIFQITTLKVFTTFIIVFFIYGLVSAEDNYHSKRQEETNKTYFIKGADAEPDPGDTAIYGTDDRKDYFEVAANQMLLADSTVLLTSKSSLRKNGDGSYTLSTDPFRFGKVPPCDKENFKKQKEGGWCSGFLVGTDLIVTAGHCVETTSEAKNIAFVFGFRMDGKSSQVTQFSSNQVYFGKKLVAQKNNSSADYAVVQLDRQVNAPGANKLKIHRNGSAVPGNNIGVVGYPSGLPVKIAFGNESIVIDNSGNFLRTNLDTYGGNSGSAVFNSDGNLVEGILVRGRTDYEIDTAKNCFRSLKYQNREGNESVTKSQLFQHHIPK